MTHSKSCISALRVARCVFYLVHRFPIPQVLVSHLRAWACTAHSSNDMSHYAHNVVATIYSPPQVKFSLCGKKPQMFGACLAEESRQFRAPANSCHSIAISRGLRAPSTCMCTLETHTYTCIKTYLHSLSHRRYRTLRSHSSSTPLFFESCMPIDMQHSTENCQTIIDQL